MIEDRPAEPGERCTCGRQAHVVFVHADGRETGYCGREDGGQKGPCAFCGGEQHEFGPCPEYRIRAD